MTRFAAIDQGTTSTRCIVFDDSGAWHLAGSLRHAQRQPAPQWCEHDPEELLANIRKVLAGAGTVDGIGLANQGESCLAWEAGSGRPLSPVIVWQDARTGAALAALPPDAAATSLRISGLPLDPYFSASKLAWLCRELPGVAEARGRGRLRLGTTDAFFRERLTGVCATDAATASRTGLLDLATGDWSAELCALHGVPIDALPEIGPVRGPLGLIGGVPLGVSIVDQQAALYGHGCRTPGACKITFGTGAFLLVTAGDARPVAGDLLPTVAWRDGKAVTFALEGGVYDAGSAVDWAQRLGFFSDPAELGTFERPSALERGIVFVPALSGLAAPHWDRRAAPLFIGMDQATDRRDLAQAVLEGIALLTAGLIEAAGCQVQIAGPVSIDGGLSQSSYFASFLARVSGREIAVPAMHELTAAGLAGLGGIDLAPLRAGVARFLPDRPLTQAERTHAAGALERARHWRL
ncbi:MAG: glycerol kinase [Defluviimonas sp.]|uniref:FGGY family carbohydrate kinase n=1 Tax=Albidovulum sp. TaxID=1872424 RepID=UPI002A300870|nr:glycerol kinase [Defluviimonas sp.]